MGLRGEAASPGTAAFRKVASSSRGRLRRHESFPEILATRIRRRENASSLNEQIFRRVLPRAVLWRTAAACCQFEQLVDTTDLLLAQCPNEVRERYELYGVEIFGRVASIDRDRPKEELLDRGRG